MISAFHGRPRPNYDRAWSTIGRFMWGFAMVEAALNERFIELFGVSNSLIFIGNLNFRQKLQLCDVGLKHQIGDQYRDLIKRLHKLHDVRNIIAHFPFDPYEEDDDEQGIDFDYVSKKGEMLLPGKPRKLVPKTDIYISDTIMPYSQFDFYDAEARTLFDALLNMKGSFTPVTEIDEELARDIAETVSLDNVIPFPERPLKD